MVRKFRELLVLAVVLVVVLFWSAPNAEACGNRAAGRRVGAVVHRVLHPLQFRHAAASRMIVAPQFYVAPAAVIPMAMPKTRTTASGTDLEPRVAALEKAATDAGRSLMFRSEPPAKAASPPVAAPKFATGPPVTTAKTVTTTRTVAATSSGCPGGVCPTNQAILPRLGWRFR